ncbi:hypothetical protein DICSQDRAFT_124669 [Dichomitus squalens LYAD-421 SS1]|uniref:Uncharacterized protein n=1 Tax=Dichomitus squalens TaxID=114155 RepID=A0A4Q9Q2Z1_9APHY|nr:uncharacterized protein DICSQDRAFT_124669 [Dichomitus squalens LYAD-421 SS1]EJF65525.1 hypothetical protein DICSQDRAFT_124669 [Dichomitus squalens LYAD-421 SS1]TBU61627.1 hypothetical protein BD310DRAFT_812544 [Dichomitus squalens]
MSFLYSKLIMKPFVAALTAAAIAATSYASVLHAKTVSNTSIAVGDKVVELVELSCGSAPVTKRQISPSDAFGDVCISECFTGGSIPATEDCQTVFNGIMTKNSDSPTFRLAGGSALVLASGTCEFFFQNNDESTDEFCWILLAQTGSALGSTCFANGASEGSCFTNTEPMWDFLCV